MKNIQKNEGFTLVEIILAIAIFSIIAVVFSGSFFSSFDSVEESKTQTKNLYESQSNLEKKIAEITNKNKGKDEITIKFDDKDIENKTVSGYIIKDKTTNVITFIPNNNNNDKD